MKVRISSTGFSFVQGYEAIKWRENVFVPFGSNFVDTTLTVLSVQFKTLLCHTRECKNRGGSKL